MRLVSIVNLLPRISLFGLEKRLQSEEAAELVVRLPRVHPFVSSLLRSSFPFRWQAIH